MRPARGQAATWEARAIVGFHQSGASSADHTQKLFLDFFIVRPIGSARPVYDSRFNVWGNVRVASSPQQIAVPVSEFVASFREAAGKVKVNELAQSAEFQVGLEWNLRTFRQGDARRTAGLVAYYGAQGCLTTPASQARIFLVPALDTPHYDQFQEQVLRWTPGGQVRTPFVGLVTPDRERFFHQWGAGFRLTSFPAPAIQAPPATFASTLGRDQLITGGQFRGLVWRTDVFYPLPLGGEPGAWRFLFLFGTVNLRLARATNIAPLALRPADSGKNLYDPDVTLVPVPNTRDTYRLGVGIDVVNFLTSVLKSP
jgi:hypothetical protein